MYENDRKYRVKMYIFLLKTLGESVSKNLKMNPFVCDQKLYKFSTTCTIRFMLDIDFMRLLLSQIFHNNVSEMPIINSK